MKPQIYLKRISCDPDILHGKPCIKGTRIPVYLIVSLVAEGTSYEDILEDYPSLTKADISAALFYGAQLTKSEAYAL